jgi:hypothetical protein
MDLLERIDALEERVSLLWNAMEAHNILPKHEITCDDLTRYFKDHGEEILEQLGLGEGHAAIY